MNNSFSGMTDYNSTFMMSPYHYNSMNGAKDQYTPMSLPEYNRTVFAGANDKLDSFMSFNKKQQEQKSKNAKFVNVVLGGVTIAAVVALIGEILSMRAGRKGVSASLRKLASARVNNNVVKRNNLSMQHFRDDVSKLIFKNGLKKGDSIYAIKAANLPSNSTLGNLRLNPESVVLCNSKGDIYKILDAKNIDDKIKLLFGNQPQVKINV